MEGLAQKKLTVEQKNAGDSHLYSNKICQTITKFQWERNGLLTMVLRINDN